MIACGNRWRPRRNSPGYCLKPAIGRYKQPDPTAPGSMVGWRELNLCYECQKYLGFSVVRIGQPAETLPARSA